MWWSYIDNNVNMRNYITPVDLIFLFQGTCDLSWVNILIATATHAVHENKPLQLLCLQIFDENQCIYFKKFYFWHLINFNDDLCLKNLLKNITSSRRCQNSADTFCYICGNFTTSNQKQKITEFVENLWKILIMFILGSKYN